ncbi:uncharacterized protein LOC124267509 isoform X2 [Haliotis rubra]|uniref:uncharacterized protein LOC124267509 isoform X2 n=1 Tax=Haliotis rubra TaxID=36100 RepID=UPI001EE575BE|nr:uncharacterized protein LOC124267509 isoform X2 [Haliotis rubra]
MFASCILLIGAIVGVFLFRRCRKRSSTERDNQGDESTHTEISRPVETSEYYAMHRYWKIDDYDEVSHPQDEQQERAESEDYDGVSQRHGQHPGPAVEEDYDDVSQQYGQHQGPAVEEDYDEVSQQYGQHQGSAVEEDYNGVSQRHGQHQGPAVEEDYEEVAQSHGQQQRPVFADSFSGPPDVEVNTNSDPALPLVTNNIPGALNTKDHCGDTSSSSASASQSYTPLVRDIFIDDPETVVRYISPTVDKT